MTTVLMTSVNGTAACVDVWRPADDYVDGNPPGYIAEVTFLHPDGDTEAFLVYTAKAGANPSGQKKWGASIVYPWMDGLPDVGYYMDRFEQYARTRTLAVLAAALAGPTELPYDSRGLDYSGDGAGYGDDYRPIGGQKGV